MIPDVLQLLLILRWVDLLVMHSKLEVGCKEDSQERTTDEDIEQRPVG